jgi:hypothetical protein
MMSLIALILATSLEPKGTGKIYARLQEPVLATFQTDKKAIDLELCIADAIFFYGSPVTLRDGPSRLIFIATNPGTILNASVVLEEADGMNTLYFRARGRLRVEETISALRACL